MTRRKFTPKFKTKVVLEALKEHHSLAELGHKYGIHTTQISVWKRDFLDGDEQVFESGKKDARSEAKREKDKLLKSKGQLKVENDFLKEALR